MAPRGTQSGKKEANHSRGEKTERTTTMPSRDNVEVGNSTNKKTTSRPHRGDVRATRGKNGD